MLLYEWMGVIETQIERLTKPVSGFWLLAIAEKKIILCPEKDKPGEYRLLYVLSSNAINHGCTSREWSTIESNLRHAYSEGYLCQESSAS